ncbi:MAG: DUF6171 family protein [Roseburia sp.]|nr:DUF6171 family protein [Roseburia sp.]MCM1241662.1 DUF6171 family protein [Roseburia sp.]
MRLLDHKQQEVKSVTVMDKEDTGRMRICKKCLIRDMERSEYFENLHNYIENLDEDIKVDGQIYEERLAFCKDCDLLLDGMCRACGCFVELRAALRKNACPYDKWMAQIPV